MNWNKIMVSVLLGFSVIACKNPEKKEAEKADLAQNEAVANKPNIVVIMCDDLGYNDVGFNGSKDIPTPNLDALATNGAIATAGYAVHPFCGPSRAGFLTGQYPHEFGSQFNLPRRHENEGKGIPTNLSYMSSTLQDAGYFTGLVGKWHLGIKPEFHPQKRGFDEFYGFLGGGHKYFPEQYYTAYQREKANGNDDIWEYNTPLEHNGKPIMDSDKYLTDELSDAAVNFVSDEKAKENPFFLFLAYNAPHVPLEAKEEDLAKFTHITDKKRRTYAAMVYAVDRGVGQLVNALKANNQLDNTLIVFLSDNGGKVTEGANNYPLKEGKGSMQEGGFRVPMFIHYPKEIQANTTYDHPISALDFYPTFAHLAQAELPKTQELHGKNIWESLTTGTTARQDESIFAMRHWPGYSDVAIRKNNFKALKKGKADWQLFNVKEDLNEENNLETEHPEVLKALVSEAEAWSKKHVTPLWYNPPELETDWKTHDMGNFPGVFDVSLDE